MRKIQISIDDETFDSIIDQGLKNIYSNLKDDYNRRKSDTGMAIFETFTFVGPVMLSTLAVLPTGP